MTLRRTPLYAAHQKAGGKLIEFGGWEMPVQYSSIVDEHLAVRRAAGLFDISHMGEVQVRGPQAEAFLNRLLTNDVRKLAVGQGQYTVMCNERGGVVDDLYAYRLDAQEFFLIVNASRVAEDVAWMRKAAETAGPGLELRDRSDAYGAVALQGPKSRAFIDPCFPLSATGGSPVTRPSELLKNQIALFETTDAGTLLIACTGYSGEDGFEIVAASDKIETVWNTILAVGHAHCCQPAGLGARDTLRTEMCYPLYGHELDEHTTPIEAGLGFFVALDKGEFIGRATLAEQKAHGTSRRCVAFRMGEKTAPPRPQYPILDPSSGSARIGVVVSGTQSPSLNCGIGMGYAPPALSAPGTALEIEVRGRKWPATVVKKPIFRK
ncbi:MAG: glycine cleavage system aminomethyltransferase GcvT [Verrucomicrobia bacterium]|nr:glycine cleavage system aminomethyltransferase GcvT [Verrucomicrobiota bacterium]MBI3869910.1 glycine cleavage system aminomethyltransferase GcvT [Verrucomicrobiota bacterium]